MDHVARRAQLENDKLHLIQQLGVVVGQLAMLDEIEAPEPPPPEPEKPPEGS